jgi:NAD(P)-dependent dehydrogenase (short-subunit alcohol dehydrogenase family)
LATTKLLSEKGANVAVLDLQETPLDNPAIKFWECNVSNDGRVEECIKQAIKWSTEQDRPLAGAVCCAGVAMAGRVQTPQTSSSLRSSRATAPHSTWIFSAKFMMYVLTDAVDFRST